MKRLSPLKTNFKMTSVLPQWMLSLSCCCLWWSSAENAFAVMRTASILACCIKVTKIRCSLCFCVAISLREQHTDRDRKSMMMLVVYNHAWTWTICPHRAVIGNITVLDIYSQHHLLCGWAFAFSSINTLQEVRYQIRCALRQPKTHINPVMSHCSEVNHYFFRWHRAKVGKVSAYSINTIQNLSSIFSPCIRHRTNEHILHMAGHRTTTEVASEIKQYFLIRGYFPTASTELFGLPWCLLVMSKMWGSSFKVLNLLICEICERWGDWQEHLPGAIYSIHWLKPQHVSFML